MAFDPTQISNPIVRSAADRLKISWTSAAPAGSIHQVYLNRSLAWYGTATSCTLPLPSSRVWIDIGVVGTGQATTDFSGTINPSPTTRATLNWQGGTYLDPAIDSFAIYASLVPGGPVNYASPLATVAAYDAGIITDGFGQGGFGQGGFGQSASNYTWTSDPLASGVWSFAVELVTSDGTQSPAANASVTITAPPSAPAANYYGQRLTYSYNQSTGVATLNWLAAQ